MFIVLIRECPRPRVFKSQVHLGDILKAAGANVPHSKGHLQFAAPQFVES